MRNLSCVETNVVSGGIVNETAVVAGLLGLIWLGGYIDGETGVVLGFAIAASLVMYDLYEGFKLNKFEE